MQTLFHIFLRFLHFLAFPSLSLFCFPCLSLLPSFFVILFILSNKKFIFFSHQIIFLFLFLSLFLSTSFVSFLSFIHSVFCISFCSNFFLIFFFFRISMVHFVEFYLTKRFTHILSISPHSHLWSTFIVVTIFPYVNSFYFLSIVLIMFPTDLYNLFIIFWS